MDTVARGLGFTRIADSGNEVVRWERVEKYLSEIGAVPTCGHDGFIPENVFYRLAMKAKNDTAERFQAFIADEVIPSIRKHGAYMTPPTIESLLDNPDVLERRNIHAAGLVQRVNAIVQGNVAYMALREINLTDLDKTTKPCGVADKSKVRQGKHFLWRTFIILASGRK
ncbi:hypothetical protein D7Y09_15025 [bacterium 1XD42-1]|nr:hypothetical protein D7Y09_15025 [bacterium 1XD42-1]